MSSWWDEQARASAPRGARPPRPRADRRDSSRLAALADLHAKGALTDEEYAAAKAQRPRRRLGKAGTPRRAPNSAAWTADLVEALVSGRVWVAVLVGVRCSLRIAFDRYERRLAERDPAVAARRRTTFGFLLRVVIALVGAHRRLERALGLPGDASRSRAPFSPRARCSPSSPASRSRRRSATSAPASSSRSRSPCGSATGSPWRTTRASSTRSR